jgi:glycosyltransferase involved in cell wall biosynthesis
MSAGLRLVQLNCAYDGEVSDPAALLDRYDTLTGLSEALAAAGVSMHVVQRFGRHATLTRQGITYEFVRDDAGEMPSPSAAPRVVVDAVRAQEPDVIHIHGLMFPGMVRALRALLPNTSLVIQDHGGMGPPGRIEQIRHPGWRNLDEADAWSFTAREHADPWRAAGVLRRSRVIEVLEASTRLTPVARATALELTAMHARPVLLWVGRLNENKDPLTVLDGLDVAFADFPEARLWMIYSDATLEAAVRVQIERSPVLRERVVLAGRVPHAQLAAYYSAADIFVSGSHCEGSGYALIEAMACGVIPCVTDIPSFRAITGECGARWHVGDGRALAGALSGVIHLDREAERRRAMERFDRHLSWPAVAARTIEEYRALVDARRPSPAS